VDPGLVDRHARAGVDGTLGIAPPIRTHATNRRGRAIHGPSRSSAAGVTCVLLLAIAARRADDIAKAFPSPHAWSKIAGLMLAPRLDNAAIWWPVLMMTATAWSLLRWLRSQRPAAFALVLGVFLVISPAWPASSTWTCARTLAPK